LSKNRVLPARGRELSDAQSQQRWPTLWDHLTQTHWDEQRRDPRKTSTITLFLREDGLLGASLNDREGAKACFAVGDGLHAVLDVLEGVAASEDTVWREDRKITGSSARRKDAR